MTKGMEGAIEIANFLGEENVEKIREYFTGAIIDNIRESVDEYYILIPDDLNDEIEKIILSAKKTLIKNRKEEITKAIEAKLNDYVDDILKQVKEVNNEKEKGENK